MAAFTVGATTFDVIGQTPQPLAPPEATRRSARSGIDYDRITGEGKRGKLVQWGPCVSWVADAAAAAALLTALAAEVGTLVDVYDADNVLYEDVLIESLGETEKRAAIKEGANKVQVTVSTVTLVKVR